MFEFLNCKYILINLDWFHALLPLIGKKVGFRLSKNYMVGFKGRFFHFHSYEGHSCSKRICEVNQNFLFFFFFFTIVDTEFSLHIYKYLFYLICADFLSFEYASFLLAVVVKSQCGSYQCS